MTVCMDICVIIIFFISMFVCIRVIRSECLSIWFLMYFLLLKNLYKNNVMKSTFSKQLGSHRNLLLYSVIIHFVLFRNANTFNCNAKFC